MAGVEPSEGGSCCRIYTTSSGEIRGVPPVEMIAYALSSANQLGSGSDSS
ncbi:MAG: hypothetical protein J7L64_03065 [Acidobacteria bacterium]|nr:hypothetical protein [Acidobacteriota bacterium]